MSQENEDFALGSLKPRGTRRVIYNSDLSNTICHLSDPAAQPVELRAVVRNYANEGKIDTLVQEVFAQAMTTFWRTDKCPHNVGYWHQRLLPMMDAGLMPVEVYIDECHKQGMEFIAGFRMNDRHGMNPDFFERLSKENPEWILPEYKPSWGGAPKRSHKYGCCLNYAVEGVRDFLFSIMEEAFSRFDIDGIELNFIRLAECFHTDEAEENHAIITDFVRRVRKMLGEEAVESRGTMVLDLGTQDPEKKVRKPILGARVPQQLEGCKKIGFDVATWIKEGLIDYVAPSDFDFTDFNEKYEDFVGLARANDCYVYPQFTTKVGLGVEIDMDPSRYRAAVGNFYGAGADGFSTYNYFMHWKPKFSVPGDDGQEYPEMYPKALNYLEELRSPESIATGDRHYVFLPLWDDWEGAIGEKGTGRSGIYKWEEIILKRDKIGERGEFRFRVCENFPTEPNLPLTEEGSGLTFFAAGLVTGDELEIDINHEELEPENLKWNWYDDERPPSCKIPLSSPPFSYGDNYLGLKIVKSADRAEGDIIVQRVECMVRANW